MIEDNNLGRRYGIFDLRAKSKPSNSEKSSQTKLEGTPSFGDVKEEDDINLTVNDKRDKLRALMSKNMAFNQSDFSQSFADNMVSHATNPDSAYPIIFKALLGSLIREMSSGEHFGERALEGNSVRTASVATLDECHFLTLAADEFNTFIRNKHRLLKEAKHSLLTEKFPGYSSLPEEELWKFQYLFQVA